MRDRKEEVWTFECGVEWRWERSGWSFSLESFFWPRVFTKGIR
ncbi:protein of unknown function [Candidatus Bipolaricaulis anaerobius]|uniref:Uncharacterized protein n=1 Tax=Candidatus Bipolaricaulis anaerobius TaxID=2026885 RepID=A0A2X3MLE7_9BACT|nr:protein of unknown function [Candidatus Bipolaricaulis anaerobius]